VYDPKVQITPELRKTLEAIDASKERIQARPVPSEEVLEKLEREFIIDTVYHGARIEGSQLTRDETERVLYPSKKKRK
jgi:hypothetical protein